MEKSKKFNREAVAAVMELISFSLEGRPVSGLKRSQISPELLQDIITLATRHGILSVVFDALFKNGLLDNSDAMAIAMRKQHLKNVLRTERMEFQLKSVSDILENAGIDFIQLKGAVIRRFYPETWMRASCDIDILVKPEMRDKAEKLLIEKMPCKFMCRTFHDVSLMAPGNVHIELHYSLIEERECEDSTKILEQVWDYSAPVQSGSHCFAMSDEMFLFYHIAHMAKHMVNGGCGIRPFIDLWLLRKNLNVNKTALEDMLHKASLEQFAKASYALCDVWFSGSEHSDLTARMEEYIICGGVYGSSQNKLAVRRGKGEGRAQHFAGLMFLPRQNLELIYPNLKNHSWLLPFYQVKRWFRVFDRAKRGKIVRNVETNGNISEKTIQKVSELMSELELK